MTLRHVLRIVLVLAVVGVQLVAAADQSAAATTRKRLAKLSVLKKGATWIESLQAENGAFPVPTDLSDASATATAVITLTALRNAGVEVDLDAAVAYLQRTDPTRLEVLPGGYVALSAIVMALVVAGGNPRDAGGADLIASLVNTWDADDGIYGAALIESIIVVMALAAAGEPYEEQAVETIVAAQIEDGSWAYDGNTTPGAGNATATAYAVQTLLAIEYDDDEIIDDAVGYFRDVQAGETVTFGVGAFKPNRDSAPDASTTGIVLAALIAAGENPKAQKWGMAVDGLLSFQNETGAWRFNDFLPFDDFQSTVSALLALAGAHLPLLPATE